MKTFSEMGLPEVVLNSLATMKFQKPTEIQSAAIPIALEGKDILGSAATGTGKTGAFSIPIISRILDDSCSSALIMSPTRELAKQLIFQLLGMLKQK